MFQDVTERKQAQDALIKAKTEAEEKEFLLRESQKAGHAGSYFMDFRTGFWTSSDSLNQIFGLDAGYDRTVDGWLAIVHPDDRDMMNRYLAEEVVVKKQKFEKEYRIIRKSDGALRWVYGFGKTEYDEDNRIVSMFGIIQDITPRKQAEVDLRDKTAQLENLTRNLEQRVQEEIALRLKNEQMLIQQSKLAAMGEMLGAIAHQWRQPLNVLGLIVQNLEDAHVHGELDKGYVERTVEKSMAQIERMSRTIDDFRKFFLPDKERSVFDTMRAVGEVISLFAAQLSGNNIDFQMTCSTHGKSFTRVEDIIPCQEKSVSGFRNEFEHVIMNLINNAREAIVERRERGDMPAGEPGLIAFDFRNSGRNILIDVSDNGGGIPDDIIGRVFEPYFTTKDPSKGTGLGLYMSAVIVTEHMQGRLTVKNRGHGAVFTIELPQA
jgi:PAS domain S-box-containing protein